MAAIRSTPKAVAEGSQLSRWWRKAGNTCIDIANAMHRGLALTSQFIQDRLRTIRKLRNIRNTDVTWNTWITRATAEWCLCDDWLRDMSWAAAKEATSIEIKCAKKRLNLWKREVQTQVQNTTAKAHVWSKAPQTWVPARAEHQGRGVVAHAQRLQEDLDVWKQVWEHTDGVASFCESYTTLVMRSLHQSLLLRMSGLLPELSAAKLPRALTVYGLVRWRCFRMSAVRQLLKSCIKRNASASRLSIYATLFCLSYPSPTGGIA